MHEFYKQSAGERIIRIVNYTLIVLLCLSIILPFLNIFALAFNPGKDAGKRRHLLLASHLVDGELQ